MDIQPRTLSRIFKMCFLQVRSKYKHQRSIPFTYLELGKDKTKELIQFLKIEILNSFRFSPRKFDFESYAPPFAKLFFHENLNGHSIG